MQEEFFRFPHTPHLAWLGAGNPRDDKVLSRYEVVELLNGDVIVEEKVDGANLGISVLDGALVLQNRGQILTEPFGGQFARLGWWLSLHGKLLLDTIEDRWVVFGEWAAARHSLEYNNLPDWWLAFDIYSKKEMQFLESPVRNVWAKRAGVAVTACIYKGRTTVSALESLLLGSNSNYRDGPLEGVIIRKELDGRVLARAKLVRADFVQGIGEHWRRRGIEWNRLANFS